MRFHFGKRTKNGWYGASVSEKDIKKIDSFFECGSYIRILSIIIGISLGMWYYWTQNVIYGAILGAVLGLFVAPLLPILGIITLCCLMLIGIFIVLAYLVNGP